ncbi:MAG: hypothetical protein P8L18_09975 [Verrucomicrobiota bacterium]|jgi:hypothetical protein|nr:hypothetical protein [Verrucomicrobiota bacterium]
MASVNDQIVREFFEMHGFLVRQVRKHVSPMAEDAEESDFWIWKPADTSPSAPRPGDVSMRNIHALESAILFVKPWHTETFTAGIIEHDLELAKRLSRSVEGSEPDAQTFLEHQPSKILILSRLPKGKSAREESITLIREKGFDGVLTFEEILPSLLDQVKVNRNYQRSDLLQTLRILKNYKLLRPLQLELFGEPGPRGKRGKAPAKRKPRR